jgi:hypothetical protein
VEIEIDGQTYSVPAAAADAVKKQQSDRHADYTRKTQEVSEQRKALESKEETLTQQAQAQAEHVLEHGRLAHQGELVEKFRKYFETPEWGQLQEEDPIQAGKLDRQFNIEKDKLEQIQTQIAKREDEWRVVAEREYADRRDRLKADLARDIPNYSTEVQAKMTDTAIAHGYSQEELSRVVDPRAWKLLHLAHLGEQVLKRQAAAKSKPKPEVTPVSKVGTGGSPKPGVHDGLSMEEWARRETQRIAKRASR